MVCRLFLSAAALLALPCASFAASSATSIAPPAGSALIARYAAKGVQIYTCGSKDGSFAWSAAEPDAELSGGDGRVFIHHSKGPTWETKDGSKVVGSVMAKLPSPTAGAVPWLLLSATASGTGTLAGAKYVVRQDTSGGVEPSAACHEAGLKVRVPYTATYAFYR